MNLLRPARKPKRDERVRQIETPMVTLLSSMQTVLASFGGTKELIKPPLMIV